jgi:hypothetical protein
LWPLLTKKDLEAEETYLSEEKQKQTKPLLKQTWRSHPKQTIIQGQATIVFVLFSLVSRFSPLLASLRHEE